MDPSSLAASIIQAIDFAGRMARMATELRNRDAKDTEFVQSVQSWSGSVGEQLESFGKQQQTDKIRELRELIQYQHSLVVEIWGIRNEKRTDQGKGSQETPSAASLRDLAEHSIKTLQDLANWFDRLQEGKGTEKGKAKEWQGRLQGLRKQWEMVVQQPPWSVPVDGHDPNIGTWREAHREPAEALYESRDSDIPGGEKHEPIEVMGMASRLPEQASSLVARWQMLNGIKSASPIPSVRWVAQLQEPSAHMYNEDLKRQDARFNMNPKVASQMDHQHRLFLETAHEAIEDTAYAHDRSSQTPCDRQDRYGCTFGCGHTARRCIDWRLHGEAYRSNGKLHFLPMEQKGKQLVLSGDTRRTYQGSANPVYHFLFSTAFALTGAVCAICMGNYDHLQPRGHLFTPKNYNLTPPLSHLSSIVLSPSPPIFVAATLIHGIATLLYYHSRPEDRYQEWFLTASIIGGTITGLCVGADMKSILLGFVPLMLIVSLVLCTGLNLLWDCCGSKRDYPSECGDYGNALQAVSIRDEEEVVDLMVKGGAGVSAQGRGHGNALYKAIFKGEKEVVEPLVKEDTTVGGKKEVVKLLAKEVADINAQQGGEHSNTLQTAAIRGDEGLLKLLVKEDANFNA